MATAFVNGKEIDCDAVNITVFSDAPGTTVIDGNDFYDLGISPDDIKVGGKIVIDNADQLIEIIKSPVQEYYSIEEIKKAFWDEFHESGELWFSYLGTAEENDTSTMYHWTDFLETLRRVKNG